MHKKSKVKQLSRIAQVLESDRLGISGDCKEVLRRDITDVLLNYFDLKGKVDVKIESNISGFNIFISAEGDSFKNFKLVVN